MKTPREDPDCDHAQRVVARKGTITVEGWMQSTRRLSVAESEFKARVTRCIDLAWSEKHDDDDDGDVGVFGTERGSAKSAMRKHLKMLKWNDAQGISWYCVQKCNGLSMATSGEK